jgi:hypothetical protein
MDFLSLQVLLVLVMRHLGEPYNSFSIASPLIGSAINKLIELLDT